MVIFRTNLLVHTSLTLLFLFYFIAGISTVSGAPTVAGATTAVASNVTANSQLLNNSMPGVVVMSPVVNGSISNTSSTEVYNK